MRLLKLNPWRLALLMTIAALIALVAQSAMSAGPEAGPAAALASPAPAQTVGGPVERVKVVTETGASSINAAAFTNVPGASTTITVAGDSLALLMARFSAESWCSGPALSRCSVRILIGGVEGEPASSTDFAFDSTGDDWESHSVERTKLVGPGTHTVQVQAAVVGGATSLSLDDWHLTALRSDINLSP